MILEDYIEFVNPVKIDNTKLKGRHPTDAVVISKNLSEEDYINIIRYGVESLKGDICDITVKDRSVINVSRKVRDITFRKLLLKYHVGRCCYTNYKDSLMTHLRLRRLI